MRQISHTTLLTAGAMILMGGITSTAFAQEFSLSAPDTTPFPGQVVNVDVVVNSPGLTDFAAANFTVSTSSPLVTGISGSQAIEGFQYADNSPSRAGGTEYRAVVYAPAGSDQVETAENLVISTLQVQISPAATPGDTIELVFDEVGGAGTGFEADGITALVGISNASGDSITPSGEVRPSRQALTLTVSEAAVNETIVFTTDSEPGIQESWTFGQGYPSFEGENTERITMPVFGQMEIIAPFVFGFFNTWIERDQDNAILNNYFYQDIEEDNGLLFIRWDVGSNAETVNEMPQVRLRTAAGDNEFFVNYLFTEDQDNGNEVLPVSGSNRTYWTVTYTDPTIMVSAEDDPSGGATGLLTAYDVVGFGATADNIPGTTITASQIDFYEVIPSSTLSGETVVYEPVLANNEANFVDAGLPEANGGVDFSTEATDQGLKITFSEDPSGFFGEFDPVTGIFGDFSFGFAFWEVKPENTPTFTVQQDKIYKIEITASSENGIPPQLRLRMNFLNNEVGFETGIDTSDLGVAGAPDFGPDADGNTYTTFYVPAPEVVGQSPQIALDAIHVFPQRTNSSVIINSLKVTEYDMPNAISID